MRRGGGVRVGVYIHTYMYMRCSYSSSFTVQISCVFSLPLVFLTILLWEKERETCIKVLVKSYISNTQCNLYVMDSSWKIGLEGAG